MATYSQGTIRKRKGNGGWFWQACIDRTRDDGKRRQMRKATGIECDPPSERDIPGIPSGKGSKQALAFLTSWRDELVAADAEAVNGPIAGMMVGEVVRKYFDRIDVEPSTRRYYRSLLHHVDLLDCTVAEIDAATVRKWVDAMSATVGSDMVLKVFDQVRAALDDEVYLGHLADNPMRRVKRPKRQRGKEPNPLPLKRLPWLISKLDDLHDTMPDFADACLFALNTGCRRQDICGLRWRDVDGYDGEIDGLVHITHVISKAEDGGWYLKEGAKNGDKRDIPMNDAIREILGRRRDAVEPLYADIADTYVFAVPERAEKWPSPDGMSKEWTSFSKLNKVVGVEGRRLSLHDLRHTFATAALLNNVPDVTVAGILGHRDSSVTRRFYARFLPDKNAEAMQQMDDIINGGKAA